MPVENIIQAGNSQNPKKALIMIHGRGGSARDIMSLAQYLNVEDYLLLGPEASNNTWYPYSFLAPEAENQPYLDSAIKLIDQAVLKAEELGVSKSNIAFLGFSQGACLTLEYVARHADRYAGAVAFTGGLIGEELNLSRYQGDFAGTPIFIGTSDPDAHVPVERVKESTAILRSLGAEVQEKIYPNMGHTISQEEINLANDLVFS